MTKHVRRGFREACYVMDKLPIADAERCGLTVAAVRHALSQHRVRFNGTTAAPLEFVSREESA